MPKYTLPPEHHFYNGRVCKVCNEHKPQEAFQIQADTKALHGLTLVTACKQCLKPQKRASELRYRYGIEEEVYLGMLAKQNGKCAICHSETSNTKMSNKLFVDHCHTTGKVRGLLCSKCNHGLGHFNDNEQLLESAIAYLKTAS